jgi:hemerythrin-like metal-binding protein
MTLSWTDSLSLGVPALDRMHREFVRRLACVQDADNEHLEQAWGALVEHAAELFGMEEAWMRHAAHAGAASHRSQHHLVLEVMREGLLQARERRLLQVREMARQLGSWFVHHVRTLDAAFAVHLCEVGAGGRNSRPVPMRPTGPPISQGRPFLDLPQVRAGGAVRASAHR